MADKTYTIGFVSKEASGGGANIGSGYNLVINCVNGSVKLRVFGKYNDVFGFHYIEASGTDYFEFSNVVFFVIEYCNASFYMHEDNIAITSSGEKITGGSGSSNITSHLNEIIYLTNNWSIDFNDM